MLEPDVEKGSRPRTLAFLMCTEPGPLEGMSVLLVRSLRTFGAAIGQAPVFSFQPRRGREIGSATRAQLRECSVVTIAADLNLRFPDYPLANKPAVARFAQRHLDFDTLVFVDSDQVFFHPPVELSCACADLVRLRPVHHKYLGSDGRADRTATFWAALYERFGTKPRHRTLTTIDEQDILGYWNSGLVATSRESGVFEVWEDTMTTMLDAGCYPPLPLGRYFTEQIALAVSIDRAGGRIEQLAPEYNYPISMHDQLPAHARRCRAEDIVSIHYHDVFNKRLEFRTRLWRQPGFDFLTPKSQWFMQQARELGVDRTRVLRPLVRRFKQFVKQAQGGGDAAV